MFTVTRHGVKGTYPCSDHCRVYNIVMLGVYIIVNIVYLLFMSFCRNHGFMSIISRFKHGLNQSVHGHSRFNHSSSSFMSILPFKAWVCAINTPLHLSSLGHWHHSCSNRTDLWRLSPISQPVIQSFWVSFNSNITLFYMVLRAGFYNFYSPGCRCPETTPVLAVRAVSHGTWMTSCWNFQDVTFHAPFQTKPLVEPSVPAMWTL